MNRPIKVLLVVLALAWIFLVTFNYYIVHKPFGAENALAILNALGDVIAAGALVALGAALGHRVLRGLPFDSPLQAIVFSTGLGLGLISFATFGLGLIGWLTPLLCWVMLLIVAFVVRGDLMTIGRAARSMRLSALARFERALAFFCGGMLAISFIVALTPPIGWDALQYHLVIPQLAIAQGRILPPPDNISLSNPALVEMLFLAAMLLKGDVVAQLLHWVYLPLTLGSVMIFAQRYFARQVGWLAMALLLAVPSFLLVSTWAYNDLALAFYGFAALDLVLIARTNADRRAFVLAGVFAGMAMGGKYTAAFIVLALAFLIARPSRRALGQALIFLVSAGIVAAPWYVRNWILMGNPIYPFVWGGPYWDAFRAAWYSRFGTGLSDPLRLLIVPWEATIIGREEGVTYQATIGALLLMLIPLGLATARAAPRHPAPRALWWFAGALYVAWLAGVAQSKLLSQTRLLFPAFPAFAILAAEAFDRLAHLTLPQFSIQRFTALVIGVVLSLNIISNGLALAADNPLAYLTGAETRAAYLARHLGAYDTVSQFVNTRLPSDARVLFLWETRAYYFRRAVQPDALLDTFAHQRFLCRDADSIAAMWRKMGYTHILLHRQGLEVMLATQYDPISADDLRVLQEVTTRHLKQIYGTTPLRIVTRDGKFSLVGAADEPYAVYEIGNTAR